MKDVWNNTDLIKTLKNGGIVVLPTDTIYGVVGKAEYINTVERIHKVRNDGLEKRCIVLISNINELEKFSINLSKDEKEILKDYWYDGFNSENKNRRPVTVTLPFTTERFTYLHFGKGFLGFRLPQEIGLQNLLKETGPLIAPSANLSGLPPAKNIEEAKNYFGDKVDMYVDGGEIIAKPSKIIKLNKDGSITVIRD